MLVITLPDGGTHSATSDLRGTDHWKGVRRDRQHTLKVWEYLASLEPDVALLQEADDW